LIGLKGTKGGRAEANKEDLEKRDIGVLWPLVETSAETCPSVGK